LVAKDFTMKAITRFRDVLAIDKYHDGRRVSRMRLHLEQEVMNTCIDGVAHQLSKQGALLRWQGSAEYLQVRQCRGLQPSVDDPFCALQRTIAQ